MNRGEGEVDVKRALKSGEMVLPDWEVNGLASSHDNELENIAGARSWCYWIVNPS